MKTRRRTIFATVAVLTVTAGIANAQTTSPVAGTYQITVCKVAPCTAQDTIRRVAWGTLVLGDTLFSVTQVADRVNSNRLRNTTVRGPINGCWVMTQRSRHARTYAGIGGLARTSWSATSDASPRVTVSLYASPDAGHTVTATFANGMLLGSGRSVGSGAVPSWGSDTIVAVRTGPPDYSICLAEAAIPWAVPLGIQGTRNVVTYLPPRVDTAARVVLVLRDGITSNAPPRLPPANSRAGGLWDPGSIVYMPARPEGVSAAAFTDSILATIRALRASGMPANRITVVGGSDGAVIAATISGRLDEHIGYVFLDGCPQALRAASNNQLHGDILSLIGTDAPADASCATFMNASPSSGIRREVRVSSTTPVFSSPYGTQDWEDLVADWITSRKLGPPW